MYLQKCLRTYIYRCIDVMMQNKQLQNSHFLIFNTPPHKIGYRQAVEERSRAGLLLRYVQNKQTMTIINIAWHKIRIHEQQVSTRDTSAPTQKGNKGSHRVMCVNALQS